MQLIQGRVSDREGLHRQLDRWMAELRPGATGYLGTTAGVTDDDQGFAAARFESAEAAVVASLKSEQFNSSQFRTMASVALEEDDYTAFQFLQWFIEEQVEEEAKMQKLLDLVRSGVNLFQAEALLDSFEEG